MNRREAKIRALRFACAVIKAGYDEEKNATQEGDNVVIWRFENGSFNHKFITHWQPLPEPPNNK